MLSKLIGDMYQVVYSRLFVLCSLYSVPAILLVIISTLGHMAIRGTKVLFESLASHIEWLTVLQDEQDSCPLGRVRVAPRMNSGPLNGHITLGHVRLAPIVKFQNHFSLHDDAVVETLGAMHEAFAVGFEVHEAADGALGQHGRDNSSGNHFLKALNIGVVVEVGRHGSGRIQRRRGEFQVCEGRPFRLL